MKERKELRQKIFHLHIPRYFVKNIRALLKCDGGDARQKSGR